MENRMNAGHESQYLIEEMNRYYNTRAPWHDRYMSYQSETAHEELLAPIIAACDGSIRGRKVLEIACGTGNWTQVLSRRAESVVAIDISPAALEIARTKLSGYKNVAFVLADAYDLGNIDGLFDVVFAADWWSHIPNGIIPSFLKTITGKLFPQSRGVFIDMLFQAHFAQEPYHYDEADNRISLRELPDGSKYQVVKNFPGESDLRAILADYAGNIIYRKFDTLKRWMVIFETR